MTRNIHVIINPASGQPQPVLHTLNSVFYPAGVDWEISITKESGDAQRFARHAAQSGADVVAVNGGDGTVMEVAQGLMGSEVPMGILPGGTANLVSVELGIPRDLHSAAEIIVNQESQVRMVDMGKVGDDHFLLRAGIGFDAENVKTVDREMKDRYGKLAYSIGGIKTMRETKAAAYTFTLDGEKVDGEGINCLVDNCGNFGVSGFSLARDISVSDGMLDVILIRNVSFKSALSAVGSIAGKSPPEDSFFHWQASEITIETDPPQLVHLDGELWGETPLRIGVVAGAVGVLTLGT